MENVWGSFRRNKMKKFTTNALLEYPAIQQHCRIQIF